MSYYRNTILLDRPMAYYALDEPTPADGVAVEDSANLVTASGNNGTYHGTFSKETLPLIAGSNGAVKFDPYSYIEFPFLEMWSRSRDTFNFSFECWFYVPHGKDVVLLAPYEGGTKVKNNAIDINDGQIRFEISNGTATVGPTENTRLNYDMTEQAVAHHFVATYTNNKVEMYLDSVLIDSFTPRPFTWQHEATSFRMTAGEAPLIVDAIAFYRNVLPLNSIKNHYVLGRATRGAEEIARLTKGFYYPIDDSNCSTSLDFFYPGNQNWPYVDATHNVDRFDGRIGLKPLDVPDTVDDNVFFTNGAFNCLSGMKLLTDNQSTFNKTYNYIENASFDIDINLDKIPDKWIATNAIMTSDANNSEFAINLEATVTSEASITMEKEVPISSPLKIIVSIDARGHFDQPPIQNPESNVEFLITKPLMVKLNGIKNGVPYEDYQIVNITNVWMRRYVEFDGTGVTSVKVSFLNQTLSSKIYIDNAQLEAETSQPFTDGWIRYGSTSPRIERTSERSDSGSYSLKLTNLANQQYFGLMSERLPADPGDWMYVRASYFVPAISDGTVIKAEINWYDKSGNHINPAVDYEEPLQLGNWDTILFRGQAPTNASTFDVKLFFYKSSQIASGTVVYLDNIYINEITGEAAQYLVIEELDKIALVNHGALGMQFYLDPFHLGSGPDFAIFAIDNADEGLVLLKTHVNNQDKIILRHTYHDANGLLSNYDQTITTNLTTGVNHALILWQGTEYSLYYNSQQIIDKYDTALRDPVQINYMSEFVCGAGIDGANGWGARIKNVKVWDKIPSLDEITNEQTTIGNYHLPLTDSVAINQTGYADFYFNLIEMYEAIDDARIEWGPNNKRVKVYGSSTDPDKLEASLSSNNNPSILFPENEDYIYDVKYLYVPYDHQESLDEYNPEESKNLVSKNVATGTDTLETTSGFTSTNAALSSALAPYEGARSLKVGWPGGASPLNMITMFGGNTTSGTIKIVPDKIMTLLMKIKRSVNSGNMKFRVYWYKADGSSSYYQYTEYDINVNTDWTQISMVLDIPWDAEYCSVYVCGTSFFQEDYYIDNISVHMGVGGRWADPSQFITQLGYIYGNGSPEGKVVAPINANYIDEDTYIVYEKESTDGPTGWVVTINVLPLMELQSGNEPMPIGGGTVPSNASTQYFVRVVFTTTDAVYEPAYLSYLNLSFLDDVRFKSKGHLYDIVPSGNYNVAFKSPPPLTRYNDNGIVFRRNDTSKNLISNGSFRYNLDAWAAVDNCTISRTLDEYKSLGSSLQIDITAAGKAKVAYPESNTVLHKVPVSEESTYTLSLYHFPYNIETTTAPTYQGDLYGAAVAAKNPHVWWRGINGGYASVGTATFIDASVNNYSINSVQRSIARDSLVRDSDLNGSFRASPIGNNSSAGVTMNAGGKPSLGTSSKTFEAWVKLSPGDDGGSVLEGGWRLPYNDSQWQFGLNQGGQRAIVSFRNAGTYYTLLSNTKISDYQIHHIVATVDFQNNVMKLYLDGQLDGYKAIPANLGFAWNNSIFITHRVSYGVITTSNLTCDEIAIYDRVLTDAEITENYTTGSYLKNQIYTRVSAYDGLNQLIHTFQNEPLNQLTSNAWSLKTDTFTTPTLTSYISIELVTESEAAGVWLIDDVQLELGTSATSYAESLGSYMIIKDKGEWQKAITSDDAVPVSLMSVPPQKTKSVDFWIKPDNLKANDVIFSTKLNSPVEIKDFEIYDTIDVEWTKNAGADPVRVPAEFVLTYPMWKHGETDPSTGIISLQNKSESPSALYINGGIISVSWAAYDYNNNLITTGGFSVYHNETRSYSIISGYPTTYSLQVTVSGGYEDSIYTQTFYCNDQSVLKYTNNGIIANGINRVYINGERLSSTNKILPNGQWSHIAMAIDKGFRRVNLARNPRAMSSGIVWSASAGIDLVYSGKKDSYSTYGSYPGPRGNGIDILQADSESSDPQITITGTAPTSGSYPVTNVADRNDSTVYVCQSRQAYIQFDAGAKGAFHLGSLSIRQRSDTSYYHFSQISIEGSNNQSTWQNIWVGTVPYTGTGEWNDINFEWSGGQPTTGKFRYIRIRHISRDTSGNVYFAVSEVRLFGNYCLRSIAATVGEYPGPRPNTDFIAGDIAVNGASTIALTAGTSSANLIDNNLNTYGYANSDREYILDVGEQRRMSVSQVSLQHPNSNLGAGNWKFQNGSVYGSIDNSSWTLLYTGSMSYSQGAWKDIIVTDTTGYRYIKITDETDYGTDPSTSALAEIKLYGTASQYVENAINVMSSPLQLPWLTAEWDGGTTQDPDAFIIYQPIVKISSDTDYIFSVYCRSADVSRKVTLGVDWIGSNGTTILSSDTLDQQFDSPITTWIQYSMAATSDPAAVYAKFYVKFDASDGAAMTNGEVHYVALPLIEEGSLLYPYFDGDVDGCEWVIENNQSISVQDYGWVPSTAIGGQMFINSDSRMMNSGSATYTNVTLHSEALDDDTAYMNHNSAISRWYTPVIWDALSTKMYDIFNDNIFIVPPASSSPAWGGSLVGPPPLGNALEVFVRDVTSTTYSTGGYSTPTSSTPFTEDPAINIPDIPDPVTLLSEMRIDNPLALWSMQETSGTVCNDVSGNQRHGVYTNVTLAQSSIDPNALYSASFNGTSSKVQIPYGSWMDTPSWTIEILVKASTWSGYRGVMGRWGLGTNDVWSFLINSGTSYLVGNNTVPTTYTVMGGSTLNTSNAYLLAGVWDASAGKLTSYINGVQWAQTNISGNARSANKDITLGIGNTGSSYWYSGKLSHAAFYGSALSTTRLLAHAAAIA